MPKIISVEGTDHEFPDDATDAEIQRTLQAAHPKPDPVSHSSSGNVARAGTSAGPYKNVANSLDMLSNVPASAGRLVSGAANALWNLPTTASNAVKTTAGLFQKMTPDTPSHGGREYVPYADAAIQGAKGRYGSLPAIGTTVTNDPVGAASDVSLVQGGVSSLARGASGAARMLNMPGVANGASDVSRVTSPFYLGRKLMEDVPVARGASAGVAGAREGAYNLPLLGKPLKAAIKGAKEDFAKSAPDYVDPKVTRQAELTTQAGDRAAARVRATAEAKAKLKADAEAKVKADAEAAKVADAAKAKALAARVEATPGGPPEIPAQPPLPEVTPVPPADGRSPSGRLYGTGNRPPLTPTPPPQRTALWQGNQSQPVAPQMTPQQPATGQLPSGRIPGTGEPAGAPPAPPVRTPLWQRSAPVPNAPIEMTPQQPPTPRAPRAVREAPQPAPQAPAVAQQQAVAPQPTTPPVAVNSGPSAPEGSTVIPPKPGVKFDAHDVATMEKINASRVANDAKVSAYLKKEGITKSDWMKTPEKRQPWAKAAGSKSRYDNPERVQHMADLLDEGPTLYQGKKE